MSLNNFHLGQELLAGIIMARYLTTLRGRICRVHFYLLGFLALNWLLNTVHKFFICLRLGLWVGHYSSLLLACFIHFKTTSDVCLQSLSCWNTQLCTSFNYLAKFGDHPSSSLFEQYISTSASKTVAEHDAVTTMLDICCSVLRFESLSCLSVSLSTYFFLLSLYV